MGWGNPADLLEGAGAPPLRVCQVPTTRRSRGRKRRRPSRSRSSDPSAGHTPYAELHCHSHFSFLDGASSPAELVEEAVRLGLHAPGDHRPRRVLRRPDAGRGGRGRPTAGCRTVYGAELSLGLSGPQNGVPDPEGSHLLVLARGVEGYHRLAAAMTDAAPAR